MTNLNASDPYDSDYSYDDNADYREDTNQEGKNRNGKNRAIPIRDESGLVPTAPPDENAVLVGVDLAIAPQLLGMDDSLTELELLAKTAGVSVVGRITQKLETPNPATLIGTGKLEELQT